MLHRTYDTPPLYEAHPLAWWLCIISFCLMIILIITFVSFIKADNFIMSTISIISIIILGLVFLVSGIFLLESQQKQYQIYSGQAHVDNIKPDQKHINQKIITLSIKDEKNTFKINANNVSNIRSNDNVTLRLEIKKTMSNNGSKKEELSDFAYEPNKDIDTIDKIEYDSIEITKN